MKFYLSFFLFCVLIFAGVCVAQQSVTSATLSGRIEDASGASVNGASVSATHIETNQQPTTVSDNDGAVSLSLPSHRRLRSEDRRTRVRRITKQLTLSVGQALDLPVKLDVAGVSAQVNVGSDVPIVETVRTQITETIRPNEINELPLNGETISIRALIPECRQPTPGATNALPRRRRAGSRHFDRGSTQSLQQFYSRRRVGERRRRDLTGSTTARK